MDNSNAADKPRIVTRQFSEIGLFTCAASTSIFHMLGLAEWQSSSWMSLQPFSDMMHSDEASSHTLLSNGSIFGVSPTVLMSLPLHINVSHAQNPPGRFLQHVARYPNKGYLQPKNEML
jgi:hypothetical protein